MATTYVQAGSGSVIDWDPDPYQGNSGLRIKGSVSEGKKDSEGGGAGEKGEVRIVKGEGQVREGGGSIWPTYTQSMEMEAPVCTCIQVHQLLCLNDS
jgi:hypothetical protein